MPRSYFCELIPARRYYGRHATGWVLLVNGYPSHFATKAEATRQRDGFARLCKEGGSKCTSSSRSAPASS